MRLFGIRKDHQFWVAATGRVTGILCFGICHDYERGESGQTLAQDSAVVALWWVRQVRHARAQWRRAVIHRENVVEICSIPEHPHILVVARCVHPSDCAYCRTAGPFAPYVMPCLASRFGQLVQDTGSAIRHPPGSLWCVHITCIGPFQESSGEDQFWCISARKDSPKVVVGQRPRFARDLLCGILPNMCRLGIVFRNFTWPWMICYGRIATPDSTASGSVRVQSIPFHSSIRPGHSVCSVRRPFHSIPSILHSIPPPPPPPPEMPVGLPASPGT